MKWFEDEDRRNFVLNHEGEVIGFFSLVNYRAGDLLVFVEQALRIKSEFNGRGYTPKITSWILNFIKDQYPSENTILIGTACPVFPVTYEGEVYSDIPKEEQARANGKYLNGSKLRTVIGTRKWIIRSITELNRQKLKEKAIENAMKSDVISSRAALQRMIASGTVEYSEKHEKHIAEIFWFPYVLDTEMHGTIIGGKQSQFHSKSEKRFISTVSLLSFLYLVQENVISHGAINPVGKEGYFTLVIDIFGDVADEFMIHVVNQLEYFGDNNGVRYINIKYSSKVNDNDFLKQLKDLFLNVPEPIVSYINDFHL